MEDSDPFDSRGTVSYLRARDPSIFSWNRHGIDKIRHNLVNDFVSESTLSSGPLEKEDTHIKVYLRMKDGVDYENLYTIEGNTLICRIDGSNSARNNRIDPVMKKYQFTHIFEPDTSQHDLFHLIIKPKILNFINARNSTLLAYGASGAGKTFTMVGTAEQPGIIPRSLEYLFRTLPSMDNKPTVKPLPSGKIIRLNEQDQVSEQQNLQSIVPQACSERSIHNKTYKAMQQRLSNDSVAIIDNSPTILNIYVSFAEVYNEFVYDLLQPPPQRGQQRPKLKIGGLQDHIYIKELKYIYIRSGLEAYQVLQYGLTNLKYANTAINMHSSRSHCIFTIRLVQGWDAENSIVSTFNFCDLAGSERLKKTMNVGDRLKESNNINSSLMVLGRCISSIRDGQYNNKENKVPPFRESKLTQIFQRALMGKEDIMMIITINPSKDMFDESQHTLNFAGIAKEIIVEQSVPKILKRNRFSTDLAGAADMLPYYKEDAREEELQELRNERANLILEISELRQEQEETLEAERRHLRNLFEEIIAMKDAKINKLEEQIKLVKDKEKLQQCAVIDAKINELEEQMKLVKDKEKLQQCDVIVLSDDDDDDVREESDVVYNLRLENQKFKTEVFNLKDQIGKMLEKQAKLKKELRESRETIEEGRNDFKIIIGENKRLRENVKELKEELYTLKDKYEAIEGEVEYLRGMKTMDTRNIEMLEDEKTVLLDALHSKSPLVEKDFSMESIWSNPNPLTSSNIMPNLPDATHSYFKTET